MPLVRISFQTGKTQAWRQAVSDAVQQAMVETIGVPPADRFHVLSEHAPGFLMIDPTFFDVARSDDPLIVQITLRAGRTDDQKRALYRRITDRLADNPGVRPQDVMISLVENALVDWSFGEGVAHYVPA
ncbi:tautomerase family protein [Aliidongia dinghuensis]|uniref:Tautomerase family protein n=1 Tax=Aliidongia dinghuensis TaxID=1867774 RepID=A0A8J2YTD5_9PROT|nr:tautomerase family protein [Aliidongia dinghuensis]GGF19070.1 tautomerase family protein [Aliidongia dinghuensis]